MPLADSDGIRRLAGVLDRRAAKLMAIVAQFSEAREKQTGRFGRITRPTSSAAAGENPPRHSGLTRNTAGAVVGRPFCFFGARALPHKHLVFGVAYLVPRTHRQALHYPPASGSISLTHMRTEPQALVASD